MKTTEVIKAATLRICAVSASSIAVVALLSGCGSGNHEVINGQGTVATLSMTTPSGVQLTLSQDKETIGVGQDVTYTVTIKNTTSAPIDYEVDNDCSLQLIPGLPSSIVLTNSVSKESATIGAGATCNHIAQPTPEVLAPGASLTGTIKSGTTLASPGTYLANLTIRGSAPLTIESFAAAQPITLGPLIVVVRN